MILFLDGYSGSLKYPKNLFIVGTVNIDETTYMFSPKVLDRANVIEFIPEKESVLDLFKTPLNSKNNILVAHSNFAKLFLNKSLDIRNDYSKLNDDIILELQGIFSTLYDLLEKCGYEFFIELFVKSDNIFLPLMNSLLMKVILILILY